MKTAALLIAATLIQPRTPVPPRANYCIGTFSSLTYNVEGGDVLGEELKVVPAPRGYEGILQVAEGEPSSLELVNISCRDNHMSFSFGTQERIPPGRFEGDATEQALTGTFSYEAGGKRNVALPRKPSYWDRR